LPRLVFSFSRRFLLAEVSTVVDLDAKEVVDAINEYARKLVSVGCGSSTIELTMNGTEVAVNGATVRFHKTGKAPV
jgi:hypothetical protein